MSDFFLSNIKKKLIICNEQSVLDKYVQNAKVVFSKFHIEESKLSKLQMSIKINSDDIKILKHAHHSDIKTFPTHIKNVINAVAFLFACFKFHGLCKNEDEYPILEGAGELEERIVLYNNNNDDDASALGHCYDSQQFSKPSLHCDDIFAGDVQINPDYIEIELVKNPSKDSVELLKSLLKEQLGLKESTSPLTEHAHITPHGIPPRR